MRLLKARTMDLSLGGEIQKYSERNSAVNNVRVDTILDLCVVFLHPYDLRNKNSPDAKVINYIFKKGNRKFTVIHCL